MSRKDSSLGQRILWYYTNIQDTHKFSEKNVIVNLVLVVCTTLANTAHALVQMCAHEISLSLNGEEEKKSGEKAGEYVNLAKEGDPAGNACCERAQIYISLSPSS